MGRERRRRALLALAAALSFAAPATAGLPDAEPARRERAIGAFCSFDSCGGRPPATLSHAAGFGAAVVACAGIARRRSPRP